MVEFKGLHKPDIEKDVARMKERAELMESMKPYLVEDPELQGWLQEINFPLMREIFLKDYVKSGGNAKDLRLVEKSNFIFTNNQGYLHLGFGVDDRAVLGYVPQFQLILVNVEEFNKFLRTRPDIDRKVEFLQHVFHEEGHHVQSVFVMDRYNLIVNRGKLREMYKKTV